MSFKSTLMGAAAALAFAMPAFAEIEVHDAYARSSNAMAGAAFMVIHNHGGADDRLIAARSDVAERVELHTHMQDENGVMKMMEVEEGFSLPTDGEILLQRGGNHVMFMGLNAPFEQGEMIDVILVFETAGEVEVQIPVDLERMDHGGHEGHDHGDHENHDHGDHEGHDHGDSDEHADHDH